MQRKHSGEQQHRDGSVAYYHQMLGALLVQPEHREVFALAPDPTREPDGAKRTIASTGSVTARSTSSRC